MFIFPLGGHSNLNMFNSNIVYNDISIKIWLQLIQNNFLGIDNSDFVKQRYKLDFDLSETVKWFKYTWINNGIFVFYNETITRELWDTISTIFKNKIVIGLTKKGIKHTNIFIISDFNIYEQDNIYRLFNKFLLHVL